MLKWIRTKTLTFWYAKSHSVIRGTYQIRPYYFQDIALSHIPLQELHITAERIQASNTPLACFEDALAEALVKWFKPNFMVWIDPILCSTCQSKMEVRRVEGPRDGEEKDGQAGRVEIHVCVKERCPGENFRFPRYM